MNDKELLTLAAKAYWGDEINDVCSIRWLDKDECIGCTHGDNQDYNGRDVEWCWDPLSDDGDCARMETKLFFTLRWHENCVAVEHYKQRDDDPFIYESFADHNNDRNAARRKASTRCAAEIGKGMV